MLFRSQDSTILIIKIILRLNVAQRSSKCFTLPNSLEIRRALLFHVIEVQTPKALWSYGNSVLIVIPSILLPFVLAFELQRIGLLSFLVKSFHVGILNKLLELSRDIGFHLRIFIV